MLISTVIIVFAGKYAGISSLIGGVIFILANIVFCFKAFIFSGARQKQQVIKSFFWGETLKFIIIIFSIVFVNSVFSIQIFFMLGMLLFLLFINAFLPFIIKQI
ncbi:ATP F0F1 synthase subunit I [Paraphotobacterium marinum]|uniref:ATP F0F1 synthase subunit I n=1 Tax=Paraphotobacterium marinum TaxID=1755811 RepID=A0A220VCX3_9GAMM|nr:ATP F0F1 synthase subunit I [Paraphotobacterium marinum]